jgi:Zn finger protein HypA/HybF involved in hydrogenase expression
MHNSRPPAPPENPFLNGRFSRVTTDGFARALEEFVEEGAAGLGAALEIMLAEVEQECASRS